MLFEERLIKDERKFSLSRKTSIGDDRTPSLSNTNYDFGFSELSSISSSSSYQEYTKNLNNYYQIISSQILSHQSLTTGLFPIYGDKNCLEGHVRDNIYCAVTVWALRQCYSKIDNDQGRTNELGQSAVKCMRGILFCWMKQSSKVEKFKLNQSPENALHTKFTIRNGNEIEDKEYGHLQIDCVSLYLLYLAQMISSGLSIIYSIDEVSFIQNLIFYIERAYRTPDYGKLFILPNVLL
jgi:phosphorylase kinase alpha/beta subunit